MMTVAPVASASGAADYYSSKDNYYFLGNLESSWLGKGAQELGLEGQVDLDTFTDVLHGKLPNGVELGKDVQGGHVHRPGHDLTFSAPKSVSLLILAGNDRELLAAHNEAVKEAVSQIEQLVSARITKDGVTQIVPTGKLIAAAFTHDTTRNLDPGIHTHVIVANVTEAEGKHRALATDYIHNAGFIETVYKHQVTLGQIYRNKLQEGVEARGFETEITGKNGLWEIKGMPAEVLSEFSSRSREIRAAVGDEVSLLSRDKAALDTRQAKRAPQYYDPERPIRMTEVSTPAAVSEPGAAGTPALTEKAAEREPVAAPVPAPAEPAVAENLPARDAVTAGKVQDARPDPAPPAMTESERVNAGRDQLRDRWQRQMEALNFDIKEFQASVTPREVSAREPVVTRDAAQAVRDAVSVLSDVQTRFTYGDLLMTAHGTGKGKEDIAGLRVAIDSAVKDGLLVPLDADKGVFTSQIHLLDELSVQALAADLLKEGRVVNFMVEGQETPARLSAVKSAPIAILNAPASLPRLREMTEQVVTMSLDNGREVQVLASSAERMETLSKSAQLKDRITPRSHVLSGQLALRPHSTLVVEGAERLGMKEVLVLTGEAREKNVQLLFMDSAGRQAHGCALSSLEAAKVPRLSLNEPAPGLEARVVSITDKRDRYQALADRYAELNTPGAKITAVVVGQREQRQLTEVIRRTLQDAGQLERDGVTVEARAPVYTDAKTRRLPGTYRAGMVLEDRSNARETRHFTIDRVHENTRMLSLIDSDGVLSRMKLSDVNSNWRLFTREELSVAAGEKLFALATDRQSGLKARERLDVNTVADGKITVTREGGRKSMVIKTDQPLYVSHGWVSAPGSRDNESGTVLAALNARELNANTLNALSQSGHEAEVFTGEAQQAAEAKLGKMRQGNSPLQLVRQVSGKEDHSQGIAALNASVMSEAKRAVNRTVAQMQSVTVPAIKLPVMASAFMQDSAAIRAEINRQVKAGELIEVPVRGEMHYVPQVTWELEKTILREVDQGKGAVTPLMTDVPDSVLQGLTRGQQQATRLVLQTPDRFTAVQGYAGVGKTTQFSAVKTAVETLPAHQQPVILGLAPTHRAVKEMREVGIQSQTIKSFVLDWQQRTSAGEQVRYDNTLILIDESSMVGLQDMAAAYRAIAEGGGRVVSVGDTDQLKSPEGGAPFKLLQERSPADVAIMKEIVRQRSTDVKAAVYSAIENRAEAALQHIDRVSPAVVPREANVEIPGKSVVETESPVDAIVSDWISRTPDARARTMIITQINNDRRAVNAGIHYALQQRGELGDVAIQIPVLERVSGGRHDFNRISEWKAGQVVKASDRYLTVSGVDGGSQRVILRDENDRVRWYSPAELNATGIEVFTSSSLEVREGDSLRFDKTQKAAGHLAHDTYKVAKVEKNGRVTLKNDQGTKVINPGETFADQHVDYGWAVTGYGAQGASSDLVIALEGTEGARGRLSGMRAFYISISRAKDHVQIYTDGLKDWMATLVKRENGIENAHDALSPQAERAQARAVWSMGHPAAKTAIGRAWMKSEGLATTGARIIPATRKYPEPHLALPVYDGNGKSAGLAMLPLQSDMGYILTGNVRMLATEGAQGAILQRSRNGESLVAGSLREGLDLARANPQSGVVWQTGEAEVSPQLMKISGSAPVQKPVTVPAEPFTVKPDLSGIKGVTGQKDAAPPVLPESSPEDLRKAQAETAAGLMTSPEPEAPPAIPETTADDARRSQAETAARKLVTPESDKPAAPVIPENPAGVDGGTLNAVEKMRQEELQILKRGPELADNRSAEHIAHGIEYDRAAAQRMPEDRESRQPEREELSREHARNIQKER